MRRGVSEATPLLEATGEGLSTPVNEPEPLREV